MNGFLTGKNGPVTNRPIVISQPGPAAPKEYYAATTSCSIAVLQKLDSQGVGFEVTFTGRGLDLAIDVKLPDE